MNIHPHVFLTALPVERISQDTFEVAKTSWQYFLAEARTRFFSNLIKENGLPKSPSGYLLEIDDGLSKLSTYSLNRGVTFQTLTTTQMLTKPQIGQYSLGVSHNQLEHLPSLYTVDKVMNNLARNSEFGMVHQVHAIDDPAFSWDSTHHINLTSAEWVIFFTQWTEKNKSNG